MAERQLLQILQHLAAESWFFVSHPDWSYIYSNYYQPSESDFLKWSALLTCKLQSWDSKSSKFNVPRLVGSFTSWSARWSPETSGGEQHWYQSLLKKMSLKYLISSKNINNFPNWLFFQNAMLLVCFVFLTAKPTKKMPSDFSDTFQPLVSFQRILEDGPGTQNVDTWWTTRTLSESGVQIVQIVLQILQIDRKICFLVYRHKIKRTWLRFQFNASIVGWGHNGNFIGKKRQVRTLRPGVCCECRSSVNSHWVLGPSNSCACPEFHCQTVLAVSFLASSRPGLGSSSVIPSPCYKQQLPVQSHHPPIHKSEVSASLPSFSSCSSRTATIDPSTRPARIPWIQCVSEVEPNFPEADWVKHGPKAILWAPRVQRCSADNNPLGWSNRLISWYLHPQTPMSPTQNVFTPSSPTCGVWDSLIESMFDPWPKKNTKNNNKTTVAFEPKEKYGTEFQQIIFGRMSLEEKEEQHSWRMEFSNVSRRRNPRSPCFCRGHQLSTRHNIRLPASVVRCEISSMMWYGVWH